MSSQHSLDLGISANDVGGPLPDIPGLHYLHSFLGRNEADDVIRRIDAGTWQTDIERRVQHFGWRYDYRARTISRDMRIGPLPDWLEAIAKRLFETGLFARPPDQAIINEYEPGQGIAMHVDRQCFGPAVATVSVGDAWRMDLREGRQGRRGEHILLEVGSALVLTGPARTRWHHGIAKRRSEMTPSGKRPRKRRISLTFRTVLATG